MNSLQWLEERFPGVEGQPDPVDWDALHAEFGVSFPEDYKALYERFGSFSLDEDLAVLGPGDILRLRSVHRQDIDQATGGRSGVSVGAGVGVSHLQIEGEFVDFDDLLRFGTTDVSYSLYWHASSEDPREWKILVGDGSMWYSFDMGIADLLVSVMNRSLSCPPLVQSSWPTEETELIPF
ncbi:hypothetical protein ACIRPH_09830 [Nocardiopsis sp. NPDC101807]|uniref:hypothetical protein n=1 Tax=Nocardiopsis sp. NPDC101807 TaxID=3364339 RepID=UPI0037FFF268